MQGNTLKLKQLSYAIITALGASSVAIAQQAEESSSSSREIETIEVTATKRAESIQDVPVTVSALSGDALENLGVDNFQDYVEFLPNVVFQGTGPGQNEIYIRGAATSQTNIAVSTVQALQPSVAFYLDEQPVSMQGRNLDIYAADVARVEVLPGPQGTLFGASSQSGTVRMITNKPDLAGFAGGIDLGTSFTKGGEMSNSVTGFLNFALSDSTAVRFTGYNDNQGGWIDNILNKPGEGGYVGSAVVIDRISANFAKLADPENTPVVSPVNDQLVEDDFNDASYAGFRAGILHEFNDDWNLLVQHTQQQLETEGVFAYDPNLEGTTSVNRFSPEKNTDTFGLTTWTLNGRLQELELVYTGGFLDRDINSAVDYTGYTNGGQFSAYYVCSYTLAPEDQTCLDPTKFYLEETDTSRFTHEFRVNTDATNNWRITAGVFYDSQELSTIGQFKIASPELPAFANLAVSVADIEGINSGGEPFGSEVSFVNDVTHEINQIALFGQAEYDLTDDLTVTLGARWYEIEDIYTGATTTVPVTTRIRAFGSLDSDALADVLPDDDSPEAVLDSIASGQLEVDLLDSNGVLTVDDVIYKASIDWKATADLLLFATYSEGFRPPVTNRVGGGLADNQQGAFEGFRIPVYSLTDTLKNYELGMKGDFFDGILRVNATAYYSEINDLQTSRFDPTNISFLVFTDNVGDAEIKGLDADITWLATDNLILDASFSLLDTELTSINAELEGIAPSVGSELPYSASFSGNVRARYFYELENGLTGYINGSLAYTGDRLAGMTMDAYVLEETTQLVYSNADGSKGPGTGLSIQQEAATYAGVNYTDTDGNAFAGGRYVQDSYVLANLSFGVTNDEWKAELFIDNVFDERAILHIDNQQFTPKVVTNRPRTVGLRLSYDFY